jgi:hypothetical protein
MIKMHTKKAKIAPSPCYASTGRQVRWRGALPKRAGCKPCARYVGSPPWQRLANFGIGNEA